MKAEELLFPMFHHSIIQTEQGGVNRSEGNHSAALRLTPMYDGAVSYSHNTLLIKHSARSAKKDLSIPSPQRTMSPNIAGTLC